MGDGDMQLDGHKEKTFYEKKSSYVMALVNKPGDLFREYVHDPLKTKNKTYYYHRKFRRVPTVDACYEDDHVCIFEANEQFRRDKGVDNFIVMLLRERMEECELYHGLHDAMSNCMREIADYKGAETNWFIKYGDLGVTGLARDALMKQKHRMIWERRHGEVGTGMTPQRLP